MGKQQISTSWEAKSCMHNLQSSVVPSDYGSVHWFAVQILVVHLQEYVVPIARLLIIAVLHRVLLEKGVNYFLNYFSFSVFVGDSGLPSQIIGIV